MVSPRTRKVPRPNSVSLRSYWISTSFLRTSCRRNPLTARERQHHAVVGLRRTEAIDARHAGDDDDVAALEERPRRREAHAVDLVVDRRFLLDVRVACRDVRLGLVVVVVADEVLDGVLREEALELLIELRGQGLVVRHHQRRPVRARDDLRHRERLARSRDPEQHLVLIAARPVPRRAPTARAPDRRGARSRRRDGIGRWPKTSETPGPPEVARISNRTTQMRDGQEPRPTLIAPIFHQLSALRSSPQRTPGDGG